MKSENFDEKLNNIDQGKVKNKPRIFAIIFTWLLAGFIFLIFLPPLIGLEGMNGGFAVSVISFFFSIMCLIVVIINFQIAKKFNKITSGDNLILHWTYENSEWQKFTEKEYKYEKRKKRMLLLIMGIIIFVIFVIFAVINPEVAYAMIISAIGLVVLLAIFAFLVPWLNYKNRKKNSGELYLSKNGVYIGGFFHVWKFLGSKLKNINFDEADMMITLEYTYPTRTGISTETVHIPVPYLKEDDAKQAVEELVKINS